MTDERARDPALDRDRDPDPDPGAPSTDGGASAPAPDRAPDVRLIGAPTDYGIDRRGVDMGPSAIRYAGLAGRLADAGVVPEDDGDLRVPRAEERDPDAGAPDAKFLREVASVAGVLADRVAETLAAGLRPVVLGGDHSIAIGSLAGTSRDADVGVVWLDAHGDFNTPATSPSGNVHGMSLAAALGRGAFGDPDRAWARAPGLDAANVALVGLRDVDDAEADALADSDVATFTMSEIDERGIAPVVDDALAVAGDDTDGVHVSLDLDFLDPGEAPGVGTPVRGGVTYREAHAALEAVARTGRLRSLELVEVNPILDEHNATADLATELAASAFGERII